TLGNLTMASGATLSVVANNSTAGQTLTFGTTSLGGAATFSPGTGATVNLAGVVSQTAPSALNKSGVGTVNLSAANTYTGATNVTAGILFAAVNGSLGASTGAA